MADWLVWNQDCQLKNSLSDEGQDCVEEVKDVRNAGLHLLQGFDELEEKNQFQGVHDSLRRGRLLVQGFHGSPVIPVMTDSDGNEAMNDDEVVGAFWIRGERGRLLGGCSNFEAREAAAEVIFRDSTFTKVES